MKCGKDCVVLSHLTNNRSHQTFTHQYLNNDLSTDFASNLLRMPIKIMIPQMTHFFPCNKNNNYLTWLNYFLEKLLDCIHFLQLYCPMEMSNLLVTFEKPYGNCLTPNWSIHMHFISTLMVILRFSNLPITIQRKINYIHPLKVIYGLKLISLLTWFYQPFPTHCFNTFSSIFERFELMLVENCIYNEYYKIYVDTYPKNRECNIKIMSLYTYNLKVFLKTRWRKHYARSNKHFIIWEKLAQMIINLTYHLNHTWVKFSI